VKGKEGQSAIFSGTRSRANFPLHPLINVLIDGGNNSPSIVMWPWNGEHGLLVASGALIPAVLHFAPRREHGSMLHIFPQAKSLGDGRSGEG
jgi:hypothetical protein